MSTVKHIQSIGAVQDKTTDLIQAMMNVDVTIRKVRHFHKDINVLSEASQTKVKQPWHLKALTNTLPASC